MIIALLTGRGGSNLKDKNVLNIDGKPCLYYPCNEAKKIKSIKDFFVSSEDKKILNLAYSYGYHKIKRPKKYSKENSKHIDVINHALKTIYQKNLFPDILVVLLANAPIIKSKWIRDCINILKKNKNLSSVVPVLENNDHHPLRAKKMKNNILKSHFKPKGKISTNRQDLEKNYFLCHNFWVIRTQALKLDNGDKPWTFLGKSVFGYKIKNSIDIHTKLDLKIAKYLLGNRYD